MLDRLLGPLVRRPAARTGRRRFLAFLDYAYMPYALGDTITWIENAQVSARNSGFEEFDVLVLASRERPAPPGQPFVTSFNYTNNIHGLIPAFLSSPMIRNVHFLENRQTFYDLISDAHDSRAEMWPHYDAMIDERIDFIRHHRIVDHFARLGSIPLLSAPRGFAELGAAFLSKYCKEKFSVVINVRQSHLRASAAHPERDSSFETWAEFIRRSAHKHSDAAFIIVGQYADVDRRFFQLPATVQPRALGFGLGVELALLQSADLFMGTSSGFAQAALFGHPSYLVTNTEHRAAEFFNVPAGSRHHPFGRSDQIVTWSPETVEELEFEFDKMRTLKAMC